MVISNYGSKAKKTKKQKTTFPTILSHSLPELPNLRSQNDIHFGGVPEFQKRNTSSEYTRFSRHLGEISTAYVLQYIHIS